MTRPLFLSCRVGFSRVANEASCIRSAIVLSLWFLLLSSATSAQSAHELYVSALAKDSAKDYTGALADLEKAMTLGESDSIHILHAKVETETNHYKEAYSEVNDVLRHNHTNFDAFMLRGILRARQQNYEGAIHDFDKCIKLNPQHAKAWYNRGLAHAYMDEIKQAISDFTKATELDDKYSIAWFQRGYWKEVSGDLDGSLVDLNKAKELNPEDKNLYVSLAVTNYRLNKKTEACTYLNEAKTRGAEKADELIMLMCNEK